MFKLTEEIHTIILYRLDIWASTKHLCRLYIVLFIAKFVQDALFTTSSKLLLFALRANVYQTFMRS